MADAEQKIKELEEQLSKTKYNKATEHFFGVVKAQIAKLREKLEKQSKKGSGKGFAVKKTGHATAALLGFPSVGKSTLINKITSAKSRVGEYDFTTLDVVPGVMEYNNAQIQILDIPGVIHGAAHGRGRGKEVLAVVRNCDLIVILVDALHTENLKSISKELYDAGIRINKKKPDIAVKKKDRGGVSISSTVDLKLSRKTIESVLREFKISNADVIIREEIDIDRLIDAVEANRAYTNALVVVTKIDLVDKEKIKSIERELKPDAVISAEKGVGIEELKEKLFQKLNFVRIFLKEVGKKPDLDKPMVLKSPVTVETVCRNIHRDFVSKFKFVRIWGKSAKFLGQVKRNIDSALEDGDIVEIHTR